MRYRGVTAEGKGQRGYRFAFTLIELIIVISLIAVLYGVFVQKLQNRTQQNNKRVTLNTLKQFLDDTPSSTKAELICLEPCKSCHIYLDGKLASDDTLTLFSSEPIVYKLDQFGTLERFEFAPIMINDTQEANVCFRYSLHKGGASSEYAVLYQKRYYLFDPYNETPVVVDSIAEATKFFDREALLAMQPSDYTF